MKNPFKKKDNHSIVVDLTALYEKDKDTQVHVKVGNGLKGHEISSTITAMTVICTWLSATTGIAPSEILNGVQQDTLKTLANYMEDAENE